MAINTIDINPQTVIDLVDGSAPVAPTNTLRLRNNNGVLENSAGGGAYASVGLSSTTIVQLPNATPTQVTALELDTTLTTNTPGAEVSRMVVKLLKAGVSTNCYQFDPDTLAMASGAGKVTFNGNCSVGTDAVFANMNLIANGDVVAGAVNAIATNATLGFLQIPTCAGTPTGTVARLVTGKACMVYDSTNFKIGLSLGGGVWKQTAALT